MNNSSSRIIFIVGVITFCIIAVVITIYDELTKENMPLFSYAENSIEQQQEEKYEKLEKNFADIFDNTIKATTTNINAQLVDVNKEIVYKEYEKKETLAGSYDINITIPNLNIKSSIAQNINREIESIFKTKATKILTQTNGYTIYNVDYTCYINGDILSLVIKSTLKEGNNPQRVIVKAYNYDIAKDTMITIYDALKFKNLKEATVQNTINEKIKQVSQEVESLKEIGYNIYSRDVENEMYKLENTDNFFLDEQQNLYIIYAYGNNENTSEIDLVIF